MDEIDTLIDTIVTVDAYEDDEISKLLKQDPNFNPGVENSSMEKEFIPLYSITNDLKSSDPSVQYYFIKNLDRFLKTCGDKSSKLKLIEHITSPDFINQFLVGGRYSPKTATPYTSDRQPKSECGGYQMEIVFEYAKKISKMAQDTIDGFDDHNEYKIHYLKALQYITVDHLDYFIIDHIEDGISVVLSELGEAIPKECELTLTSFYESGVVAKQCLIPPILTQFYLIIPEKNRETYVK